MKRYFFFVSLLLVLLSCNQTGKNSGSETTITPRVRKQVMGLAVNYVREKYKDPQQSVLKNGAVRIGDNQMSSIIDPATIVTGFINSDGDADAVLTVASFKGRFKVKTEHLILLKTTGKFSIARVIEAEMKIMRIKDMMIFAEVSKYPPDSPSADCPICKEIVKFQFRDGNLVRAE
jgi:hypothetical protein